MFVGHVRDPFKTAERIEMPFGWATRVGLRNHVLDEGRDPLREWVILGDDWPTEKRCKAYDVAGLGKKVSHIKMVESIEMLFRGLIYMGPDNHILDNSAMRPFAKLLWTPDFNALRTYAPDSFYIIIYM